MEPERPAQGKDRTRTESAIDALARARTHARRAVGEALAAAQALLDAASLGWSGQPSDAHAALRGISQVLEEQSRRIREDEAGVPGPVIDALLAALEQEIGRWEKRAERDPDARAVLRTFLGLREILWEFGFRRDQATQSETQPEKAAARSTRKRAAGAARRARVQRVDVKG